MSAARSFATLCFMLLALSLCLAGHADAQGTPSAAAPQKPLQVFAAASLKNALDAIARDWVSTGHAPLSLIYAASSTLAQQIMADAPADLFISADLDWMDWLSARGRIKGQERRIVAGNVLVLIGTAQNRMPVTLTPEAVDGAKPLPQALAKTLPQALGQGLLAIADPRVVPAGKYGKAALTHLGLWDQLARKIVPADHVRAVVAFVARAEAPYGIVYRSDVHAEPAIREVAAFPANSHPPILYPAAVMAHSTHPEASLFLNYLAGPEAQARLVAEGFTPPPAQEGKP